MEHNDAFATLVLLGSLLQNHSIFAHILSEYDVWPAPF